MINIEFQPIVPDRNYAPTRSFVTKWDVEIEKTRAKKIARRRDRDTKHFDHFDDDIEQGVSLPPIVSNDNVVNEIVNDDDTIDEEVQYWRTVRLEATHYDEKKVLQGNFEWYDMNNTEMSDMYDTPQTFPQRL
jgi:hypothetical protein